MGRKIVHNNTLIYSFVIALPLAILFGILLPVKHSRYNVTLNDTESVTGFNSKFYVDFDNDGYSEFVLLTENMIGNAAIKCYTNKGYSLGQFNLESKFISELPVPFFDDYNEDGYKELFLLTHKKDSLFLNGFNSKTRKFFIFQRFIDNVPLINGENDFNAHFYTAFDANNDKQHEVFLVINAGFSLQPRNHYRFDIAHNKLIKSPKSYSKSGSTSVFDINGDGVKEILCINSTSNNYSGSAPVPFPDSLNWVFVFNAGLKFLFPPKSFQGAFSRTYVYPIKLGNKYGLICIYTKRGEAEQEDCIMLMNNRGEELKRIILPATLNGKNHLLFPFGNNYENFLLMLSDGRKYKVDNNLTLIPILKHNDFLNDVSVRTLKINNYDFFYIFYNNNLNKIAISTSDFKHIKEVEMPEIGRRMVYSLKKNGNTDQIYIQNPSKGYYITYSENKFFYLNYSIYLGEYLLFVWFTFFILNTQRKRIVKMYETEKRLNELQFQNIKNQLTPHFTFNVLNSIGKMVRSGKADEAYDYLSKNSKMLHTLINESNEVTRTLNKEIAFVEDYLALQKLRFKERYQFSLNVAGDVDLEVPVPKMIIHTYVENAIKHGLSEIKENGKLDISVTRISNKKIGFIISDNGTGIHQEKVKQNNGRGLKLMQEYFKLFEDYYDYKIVTSIEKRDPDDIKRPGTKVRIELEMP